MARRRTKAEILADHRAKAAALEQALKENAALRAEQLTKSIAKQEAVISNADARLAKQTEQHDRTVKKANEKILQLNEQLDQARAQAADDEADGS